MDTHHIDSLSHCLSVMFTKTYLFNVLNTKSLCTCTVKHVLSVSAVAETTADALAANFSTLDACRHKTALSSIRET